ncbi:Downstream target of A 2 [Hibiscus syriacus]|uniref:Downstream target of A 2 n=1 Tax=Hibiscus syriacus TaxID=106335 RepID=A0A6A3D234_HIBSY|nr:Downstream target of A 2 [Hibiscus syriacus]
MIWGTSFSQAIFTSPSSRIHHEMIEYPLNCSNAHYLTHTCPDDYPSVFEPEESTTEICPDYFRWLHQDLKQWRSSGIIVDAIERGIPSETFRLVIVNGDAYVEKYRPAFQTRDEFTIWGILQLLRLYPGRVPDLDLLFFTGDRTWIIKRDYKGPTAPSLPPPVFHYCGEKAALDIVFPDWTFWGWAEVKILPWEQMLRAIKQGREKIKWEEREPYAFWKGNPHVAADRVDLMKCNLSDKNDWNVRVYKQDWRKEIGHGFQQSKLEDQCTHRYMNYENLFFLIVRELDYDFESNGILNFAVVPWLSRYKIYIEGATWSRSLVPMRHFWPVHRKNKCRDLKFAVDWGNDHTREGKREANISKRCWRYVYDYMFHMLNEYSKLLKFKPTIPPKAQRVCAETAACSKKGLWKDFMVQSMVKSPSDKLPCTLPPPYEPQVIQASLDAKEKITKPVETWETEYWKKLNNRKQ